MATTIQLQARLEAIKKARDSGALMVRHENTQTQFRSLDEMNRIITQLEGEIAAAADTGTRVRAVRVLSKDGW
jgi:hypothetical protein